MLYLPTCKRKKMARKCRKKKIRNRIRADNLTNELMILWQKIMSSWFYHRNFLTSSLCVLAATMRLFYEQYNLYFISNTLISGQMKLKKQTSPCIQKYGTVRHLLMILINLFLHLDFWGWIVQHDMSAMPYIGKNYSDLSLFEVVS